MLLAFKSIQYGGVDNIPPQELSNEEREKIKQHKYEQAQSRLETAQHKNQGDNVGEFPWGQSHGNTPVNIHTAINELDCDPTNVN